MRAILDRQLWSVMGRVVDAALLTRAIACVVLAGVAASMSALSPVFLAQIVDGLTAGLGEGVAWPVAPAVLYLGCLAAGRLIGQVQAYHYMIVDQSLQRRISQATLDHLLRLPLSFHLHAKAGSLIQIYQNAVQGARILTSLACATLLPIIVQLAVILSVVVTLFDFAIWLLVICTVVAYAIVFTWNVGRVTRATGPAIARYVEATGRFSDAITNIEAVKSNTAEERLGCSYANISAGLERAWRVSYGRRLEAGLAISVVFSVSMGAAMLLCLERAEAGQLSAGSFVLLAAYMLQIIGPLETTGYAFRDLAQGASFLSDWKDLLGQLPEDIGEAVPASDADEDVHAPMISFENISLAYDGTRHVLRDVSLEARAGEMLAIVGATGAGKTSLLRLLQKHIKPDEGRVTIDGRSVSDIDTRALRGRISVVSQDVVLFNETLRYNLAFANSDATDADIAAALAHSRLDRLVSALPEGLDTIVGERGLKLSGGERQRVAIARAMLRGGDILLLDEATSSLDVQTERDVLEALTRVADGRTTIVVTHRLALAALATRIAVLKDGRVVETGRHEELLARHGAYAALWEAQTRTQEASPTLASGGR